MSVRAFSSFDLIGSEIIVITCLFVGKYLDQSVAQYLLGFEGHERIVENDRRVFELLDIVLDIFTI